MGFSSPLFFLFLLLVVAVNFFLPQRYRKYHLLLASFAFIAWFNLGSLVAVLCFSAFSFYSAKAVSSNKPLFLFSVLVNIAAIILFNYFSLEPSGLGFHLSGVRFDAGSFILALGLSFYSLQNIAYLTEVYNGRRKAETELSGFILYNAFFAKVISGPVMLPAEFLPQVSSNRVSAEKLIGGFQRFILGLFKKLVIADNLAPSVASIFDYNDYYSGLTTVVAACLFTIQLYFDFSGYTDMALGIGKMLGYELKENFRLSLRSTSVGEFWRRWHISLISWFTQYIYYPFVYRLRSYKKAAALIGVVSTFLVSALWHGAGLTFLLWGICHVVYLSFELFTKKIRLNISRRMNKQLYKLLSAFLVFSAVSFSHIFFRAGSLEKSVKMINTVFIDFLPANMLRGFLAPLAVGGHQQDLFNFYMTLIIAVAVLIMEKKINAAGSKEKLNVLFVTSCILLIFFFGVLSDSSRFIYMQF